MAFIKATCYLPIEVTKTMPNLIYKLIQKMIQGSSLQDQMIMNYIEGVFNKYDTDRTGTLDVKEMTMFFNELFRSLNINTVVTEEQALEAIKSIDDNSDGQVNKEELFKAFKAMLNPPQRNPQNPQSQYGNQNYQNYNNQGYNNQGYNNQGYNSQGYNSQGYNSQGYNNQGYNRQGYNSQGYNMQGQYVNPNNQGYNYPNPPPGQGYPNQGYPNQGYSNSAVYPPQQGYQNQPFNQSQNPSINSYHQTPSYNPAPNQYGPNTYGRPS